MHESNAMVASVLSPGPVLNSMSSVQLGKFSEMLNEMIPGETSLMISLNEFVKKIFTIANAFTIYGPKNPFALYPDLVDKLWQYEAGMVPLLANIFPSITARKPYLARKAVNAALQEFVETEAYKSASPLIQKRVAINLKYGLTTRMAGHAELILLFGIIGNAVPTTFWFLTNVFSRPELLAQIRTETAAAVSINSPTERVINVTNLKTACPLLVSTYRETLRTIANLASVRLVVNTHTVSSTTPLPPFPSSYLLRKGGMIQIASGVIHASESVWGPDAKTFNPTRFISSSTNAEQFSSTSNISAERTASQLPKNVPSAAYRAFGGGSVICPGRHFAQSEILGFVALCVHMFDVKGVDGGAVPCPKRDDGRIPLSVMKPDTEPEVMIKRRSGEEGVIWRLEL
jgi:cytochrome P450